MSPVGRRTPRSAAAAGLRRLARWLDPATPAEPVSGTDPVTTASDVDAAAAGGLPEHWRALVAARAPGLLRGEGIGLAGTAAQVTPRAATRSATTAGPAPATPAARVPAPPPAGRPAPLPAGSPVPVPAGVGTGGPRTDGRPADVPSPWSPAVVRVRADAGPTGSVPPQVTGQIRVRTPAVRVAPVPTTPRTLATDPAPAPAAARAAASDDRTDHAATRRGAGAGHDVGTRPRVSVPPARAGAGWRTGSGHGGTAAGPTASRAPGQLRHREPGRDAAHRPDPAGTASPEPFPSRAPGPAAPPPADPPYPGDRAQIHRGRRSALDRWPEPPPVASAAAPLACGDDAPAPTRPAGSPPPAVHDPWPALPDDAALWTVPAATDQAAARRVRLLEREQAGT